MKFSEKYTEDEWRIISSIPQAVGVIMAGTGRSGLFGSGKETIANARALMSAENEFADNGLIQEIIPDPSDQRKAIERVREQTSFITDKIKENNIKDSEQLSRLILEDCKKSIELIEAKEDATIVNDYKKWLLIIAKKVANAAKEGDFLGFGGERFSEKEQRLYRKLKTVLNQ